VQSLCGRERKVLQAIAAGTRCKRIASDLGVSERTVKGDRARIMKRLRARSIADLFKQLFAAGGVEGLLQ
jgi:FixJ family two-component response regulator